MLVVEPWELGERVAYRLTINEKIRRSQGDMLGGEPCIRQSPKMSPVPARPVVFHSPRPEAPP